MPESKIITSESMVDNHDLRNELIARTEVLDKVKKLLLIPEMNCMTIRQVADYYEVDIDTLKKCCKRNKDEIILDGVVTKTPRVFKDLLKGQDVPLVQNQTNLVIQIDDNTRLEIPNRGIKCFSKRAVLRIGMLLRDSKIAQEVRTQLLNIVEHTAEEKPELLTQDIDDEEKLQAAIGKAFATGDIMEFATAAQAYTAFQRRHIDRIETSNKLLTAEVLHISDRKMFNRVMRKFASTLHISFGVAFSMLYKQLSYRYGIDLKKRGDRKTPYIQYIKDDEWDKVQKVIVAILEKYNVNVKEFFESCSPTFKEK
ncbi:hypothetical protein [Ruminococcus bicirculans (ex Wegman et al. 2014)]|uniref:hypothetical protein n=1 Tax=Ruminococcus bicirculans (ex Wegman et al. 2014) TaxID=1160721 RepID=UPI00242DB7F3|nr:hypothetical protein [Ruminococcus bicirculans (ex Wegman et al. 2014)]MBS6631881.1 hypothetical protein [Ruminococcus bicirculans (ex Wegman et al. 2014)]